MKVAVIQMQCHDNGDKNANIQSFRRLVHQACTTTQQQEDSNNSPSAVELILGPEFALCGYTYDYDTMWKTAECQGGVTEQLLCELGKQYGIFIGVSYLEAREIHTGIDNHTAVEYHFCNTFALAGPDGTIVGRVGKTTPCSVEAYYFGAPQKDTSTEHTTTTTPHVLECRYHQTTLRIGVLICYENYIYDSVHELQQQVPSIDILLQPFSGPLADDQKAHVKESLRQLYLRAGPTNARYLHCPALYCNKVGPWKQPSPSQWFMPMMTFDTEFPGGSAICTVDGEEAVPRMDATTVGVLLADVVLGRDMSPPQLERPTIPRYWGGYTDATPFLKICRFYEWLGARSYQRDPLRQRLAQEAVERHKAASS